MAAWQRADVEMMSHAVFGRPYSSVAPSIHPSPSYRTFMLKKRDGSFRPIHEPRRTVKKLQLEALAYLKQHLDFARPCVHGFVKQRSILTNARAHCDRRPTFVLNIDLKDFFPSVTFYRVRGALQKAPFGFSHEVATVLAHLFTFNGSLPQGAPTSPYLANLVCRSLDRDLMRLAQRHRAFYTRYADDITISFAVRKASSLPKGICEFEGGVLSIGAELRDLVEGHSFSINDKKTRISSKRSRQEVTGLVINEFPNVRREFVDPVRGALNAWQNHGYSAAQQGWLKRISVKPRFAEQIVAGSKTVEFRRVWAAYPVGLAVVYSSSPVQRLVGIVEIEGAVVASPASVWTKCRERGPGLRRQELLDYFADKGQAYGVLLGTVTLPTKPIPPKSLFKGFRPPQSYRYLSAAELRRIGKQFGLVEEPA